MFTEREVNQGATTQSRVVLTCGLESSHESETEDDEEASEEAGHADLLQLLALEHLEEGDVQQGAAGDALKQTHDQDLRGCK